MLSQRLHVLAVVEHCAAQHVRAQCGEFLGPPPDVQSLTVSVPVSLSRREPHATLLTGGRSAGERGRRHRDDKVANRNDCGWHGATEKGPCTIDKAQTFAAYVYPSVRATIMFEGLSGRGETAE